MTNAAVEGDDFDFDPIKVRTHGAYFAATDQISATGENPLRTLAQALLDNGTGSERVLEVYRAGELVARTTAGRAAGANHE
jgi:hypothetical protein